MLNSALIDLHYLPSLEFFCAVGPFEKIALENHEHFVKQSYRNRTFINTANGVEMLVVPLTSKSGKPLMKDVKVDYTKKWVNNHWRAIESSYRSAPYFEHYYREYHRVLYSQKTFLLDLNYELLSMCLQFLKWEKSLEFTSHFEKEDAGLVDFRNQIRAKQAATRRNIYRPVPYHQVFGNAFAPNLSIIDLLFCEGPEAARVLSLSATNISD